MVGIYAAMNANRCLDAELDQDAVCKATCVPLPKSGPPSCLQESTSAANLMKMAEAAAQFQCGKFTLVGPFTKKDLRRRHMFATLI